MSQEIQPEDPGELLANVSASSRQQEDVSTPPAREETQSQISEPVEVERITQAPCRGATGPRSEMGKRRSSLNAVKHGIHAQVTILPGESRAKYHELQKIMSDWLQPEDEVDEYWVDQATSIEWRRLRGAAAEGAEIRHGQQFIGWTTEIQNTQEAGAILTNTAVASDKADFQNGLICRIHNPYILEECLKSLLELRREIKAGGFDRDRQAEVIENIYGKNSYMSDAIFGSYHEHCCSTDDGQPEGDCDEEEEEEVEEEEESPGTAELCWRRLLSEISREIRRLRVYKREYTFVEAAKQKLEVVRRGVPEPGSLDRFLKYDASLRRSLDWVVNQIDRRRLRRGQPIVPRRDFDLG